MTFAGLDNETHDLIKNIMGYLSTVLLSLLYLPQVYRVYFIIKDPFGLSPTYLSLGLALAVVALIYGIFLEELPLIIANAIAFVSVSLLLIARKVFPRPKPNIEELAV